jgi:hypothetical protein
VIQEIELNLFVPSPELLVRLASGPTPLGVRASPPRIKALRETFFDTPDQVLRRRGMTCKLRQVEGEEPSVVVTVGESPDSLGITSRSRLTAAAIGVGVFETLRGDSEPAIQLRKFVEPSKLRPQIALDIQRLGRVFRGGLLLSPVLLLFFDRITVQMAGNTTVFHELRIRRRRKGGPLIQDLAQNLRDEHHLFPDGLTTLQRAYRILAMERKTSDPELSPYALSLALSLFRDGQLALQNRGSTLSIPTFRGSGEDAARALASDLLGNPDLRLLRLGTTEPRAGRPMVEVWTVPDPELPAEAPGEGSKLVWRSWHRILEEVGHEELRDPTLVSSLLLLTRRRLLGQIPWIPRFVSPDETSIREGESAEDQILVSEDTPETPSGGGPGAFELEPELQALAGFLPLLREVEDGGRPLPDRLRSASEISKSLSSLINTDVTRLKGQVLSATVEKETDTPLQLLDLISIRVRGITDRLYQCLNEDLLPALEESGVQVRPWTGLMNKDRRAILEHFSSRYLPSMQVAPEWGPAFIPDMPLEGCAVGLLARSSEGEGTRFFHIVLDPETPAFLPIPGTSTVLPLEEVVRGYFLTEHPALERAQTYLFRFMTGGVMVRELVPRPEPMPAEEGMSPEEPRRGWEGEDLEAESRGYFRTGAFPVPSRGSETEDPDSASSPSPPGAGEARADPTLVPELSQAHPAPPPAPPPAPEYRRVRQSVVVRVLARKRMPESVQAQLLRALERQVSRRIPLIGWSDLYPVTGPLDLSGLDELMQLPGD